MSLGGHKEPLHHAKDEHGGEDRESRDTDGRAGGDEIIRGIFQGALGGGLRHHLARGKGEGDDGADDGRKDATDFVFQRLHCCWLVWLLLVDCPLLRPRQPEGSGCRGGDSSGTLKAIRSLEPQSFRLYQSRP